MLYRRRHARGRADSWFSLRPPPAPTGRRCVDKSCILHLLVGPSACHCPPLRYCCYCGYEWPSHRDIRIISISPTDADIPTRWPHIPTITTIPPPKVMLCNGYTMKKLRLFCMMEGALNATTGKTTISTPRNKGSH